MPNLYVIPAKNKDDVPRAEHESYNSALCRLQEQVSLSDWGFAALLVFRILVFRSFMSF